MKQAVVILSGTLFVVGCGQMSSPASPSSTPMVASPSSISAGSATSSSSAPQLASGQLRVGFSLNGTVSGFPKGLVFVTGGGSYNRTANVIAAGGGFRCIDPVLQGPLSMSINPDDPGACQAGEGVRWDTAALLPGTMFKCTGAGTEALKPAATSDTTVVLTADFYRASNGNDESFRANMIVSTGDLAPGPDFPGVQNLWVQGVGCGTAAVNFSR